MNPEYISLVTIAISSGVTGILSAIFTYMGIKRKSMSSAFDSILEANERFRQEVRNDLIAARADAEMLRTNLNDVEERYRRSIEQIINLQRITIDYQQQITELTAAVNVYQNEICILKSVIDDYKIEVEKLREELSKLINTNHFNVDITDSGSHFNVDITGTGSLL